MTNDDTRRTARRAPGPGTGRPAPRGQQGFALAVVLIALVGLTAVAVGGWMLTGSGFRASEAQQTSLRALSVANAGLEELLATHQGQVTTTDLTFSYPDGTADVELTKLNDANVLQSVWRIRSTGSHPLPKGGTARRTVQTIAVLDAQTFQFPSSFTSATGLHKTGNSGTISGHDMSTSSDCPQGGNDDTNGVAVPTTHPYDQSGGGGGGGNIVPDGSPKDTAWGGSQMELLESTGVDWPAMVSGDLLQFDYTIPPDAWPNFASMPSDEWPVIYVDNAGGELDMGPGYSGRGTLIVRGDLKISGNTKWEGPIMVGGAVTTDGKQTIHGAVASGFNLMLGESVAESSIGHGSKDIIFHSCNLHMSMEHTATFVADPGTWSESF